MGHGECPVKIWGTEEENDSAYPAFLSLRTLNAGAGKDNLGHRISSVDEETPLAVFLVLHSSPFALTNET